MPARLVSLRSALLAAALALPLPAFSAPSQTCSLGAGFLSGAAAARAAVDAAARCPDPDAPELKAAASFRDWSLSRPGAVWLALRGMPSACSWTASGALPSGLERAASAAGLPRPALQAARFASDHERGHCASEPEDDSRESTARSEAAADEAAFSDFLRKARSAAEARRFAFELSFWRLSGWLSGDKAHPPALSITRFAAGAPFEPEAGAGLDDALLARAAFAAHRLSVAPECSLDALAESALLDAEAAASGWPRGLLWLSALRSDAFAERFETPPKSLLRRSEAAERRRIRIQAAACKHGDAEACDRKASEALLGAYPQLIREGAFLAAKAAFDEALLLPSARPRARRLEDASLALLAAVEARGGSPGFPVSADYLAEALADWCRPGSEKNPTLEKALEALGVEASDCADIRASARTGSALWSSPKRPLDAASK